MTIAELLRKEHPDKKRGPRWSLKCSHLRDQSCQRHIQALISSIDTADGRLQSIFTCTLQWMPRSCHHRWRVNILQRTWHQGSRAAHSPAASSGGLLQDAGPIGSTLPDMDIS